MSSLFDLNLFPTLSYSLNLESVVRWKCLGSRARSYAAYTGKIARKFWAKLSQVKVALIYGRTKYFHEKLKFYSVKLA